MVPQVSVVLPAYNGERFLRDAVESVLAQTFGDFELIVVDDGSTDRTPEILADFERRDPRVAVHRHAQNRGFRTALNTGCRLARAPFVAKMSHDDISLPLRLERQLALLRARPDIGVIGTNVQIIDENGRRGRIQKYPANAALVAWSMLFFNAVAHPAVMMRRELLDVPDAYPDGCTGGTEDYAMFSRLSRTSRVANLDEVLLLYRSWTGNMTHTLWMEQEQGAARIARSLAGAWNVELSEEQAMVLRDLSRERYPEDASRLRAAAVQVHKWTEAVLPDLRWSADDRTLIVHEAAIKLMLISALVARRSPRWALSIATSAVRMSPAAPIRAAMKAARAIWARRRGRPGQPKPWTNEESR